MIRVTWEKSDLVKDVLNDLAFIKVLFDIRETTIPYVSKYAITVDSFYINTATVNLTVTNSKGKVTNLGTKTVEKDESGNYLPVSFEVNNFEGVNNFENEPVITLGKNTLRCTYFDANDNVISYDERLFECKYILSILTWILWTSEDIYKELLGYVGYLSLKTIPEDDLYKKVGFLLDQPFYISSTQYRKIIGGLFRGALYGGTVKGLRSVLDGVKSAFDNSDYELLYAKEITFWRLPARHASGKFYTKYTDQDLDKPGEDRYKPVNSTVFKDTKPDRIHFLLKKEGSTVLDENNVRFIMLLSNLVKQIGYIVKFYNLVQPFDITFTVTGTNPEFETNLPCIVKTTGYEPKLYKLENDNWIPVTDWSVKRTTVAISGNFNEPTTFKITGHTIPFDVVKQCINYAKSVLTNVYALYYQDRNKPLFEIYTEE
jgi:hypothetical protein